MAGHNVRHRERACGMGHVCAWPLLCAAYVYAYARQSEGQSRTPHSIDNKIDSTTGVIRGFDHRSPCQLSKCALSLRVAHPAHTLPHTSWGEMDLHLAQPQPAHHARALPPSSCTPPSTATSSSGHRPPIARLHGMHRARSPLRAPASSPHHASAGTSHSLCQSPR